MNKQTNQDKGFTLVELLIVIVILGILATVTVFAVRGITDDSRTNSCAAEKKTIETAIEAYYADNGADANDIGDLVPGFLKQNPFDTWDGGTPGVTPALTADDIAGTQHFTITFGVGEPTLSNGTAAEGACTVA